MAKDTLKFIRPGVQVREGKKGYTIRYFASVGGKRYTAASTIAYADAVNPRTHKPTKLLNDDYATWVMSLEDQKSVAGKFGRRPPTIRELIETYEDIAERRSRNPLFGKPGAKAIYTACNHYKRCVEISGLTWERPATELLHPDMIKQIFNALGREMKPISAWSAIMSFKSVTANWAIEEYEARGYSVESPRLPPKPIQANAPQYRMMRPETREKIEKWYLSLTRTKDRTMYLGASMIFQLAVRPIDWPLITAENFKVDPADGMVHLVYKPHKTQNSSGRIVDWPVLPALWEEIRAVAGERLDAGKGLIPNIRTICDKLNISLRLAVPELEETNKAVYELRKLCVDTIRRTMGADAAVAISGDRRDTIDKYYSDPYKMVGVKPIEIAPMAGRAQEEAQQSA